MRFNIIGFSNTNPKQYKHCVIHSHIRLVQSIEDPDKLFCPSCGTSYLPKDSAPDDVYQSRFGPQQTRIITPKKQKRYYDKQGNEITDETLIQDIQNGANVIHYRETMPAGSSETDTKDKKVSR